AGGQRGGASLGVEGRPRDPAIVDGQRHAHQVAARGATGGAAERARGGGPAARIVAQVGVKYGAIHQMPRLARAVNFHLERPTGGRGGQGSGEGPRGAPVLPLYLPYLG